MKAAIYTIITGGYDDPIPLNTAFIQGMDAFMFTDDPNLTCDGWEVIQICLDSFMGDFPDGKLYSYDPVILQRSLKINIPERLRDYDYVVYIDANVEIIKPISYYLKFHKGNISLKQHPKRNCMYQEGFACIERKKADPEILKAQMKDGINMGIQPGSGMYETNVIVRNKSEEVDRLCSAWWEQLTGGSHRDQMSIIPAREKSGVSINAIPYNQYQQVFRTRPHVNREPVTIHYIQPYSTNKHFGQSINQAIERLNADPEDWIVLTDYDAMFMTPDYGRHISEMIIRNRNKYDLIGAKTNRIRADHQKVPGMFDEYDIRTHAMVAKDLEEKNWCAVEPCSGVAGFCMIFPKKIWNKVKFKDSIKFDTEFNNDIRRSGGKIGIANGLYLMHMYRILSNDPINDTKHLK